MAFTGNYVCTSFKLQLLQRKHDFVNHTFKLALYDNNASFTDATTDYTATNEVSGTGYTAGGVTLTLKTPTTAGTTAIAGWEDATISTATITARGGMIYNTTTDGGAGTTDAIIILDFGRNITKTAADFVITMPTFDALNALIRIT